MIPGLGKSAEELIGYPLQYSWAPFVAQLVKNPPAIQENWARSLAWEDPLAKGKATHSSILAWRIPWTVKSMGSQRVGHNSVTFTTLICWILLGYYSSIYEGYYFSKFSRSCYILKHVLNIGMHIELYDTKKGFQIFTEILITVFMGILKNDFRKILRKILCILF